MDNDIETFFEDDSNRGVASVSEAARLLDIDEQDLRRTIRSLGGFRRVGSVFALDRDDVLQLADELDGCYQANEGDEDDRDDGDEGYGDANDDELDDE